MLAPAMWIDKVYRVTAILILLLLIPAAKELNGFLWQDRQAAPAFHEPEARAETTTGTPKLHMLLVCGTAQAGAAESCQANYEIMQRLAKETARNSGLELKMHILKGKDVRREKVRALIDSVQSVGSDDVLWLYYTGHAVNAGDGSKWSRLLVPGAGKALTLEGLRRKLLMRGARLTLVTADCCNLAPATPKNEATAQRALITARNAVSPALVRSRYAKLFREASGELLASGCRSGERSYAMPAVGGFFTYCLSDRLYELTRSAEGRISWVRLLEETQTFTRQTARSVGKTQLPQFEAEILDSQSELDLR